MSEQKFLQELAIGRHDDNLDEVLRITLARILELDGRKRFRIAVDSEGWQETIDQGSVSMGTALDVEQDLGIPWGEVQGEGRPDHLRAVLVHHLANTTDLTVEQATEKVRALSVDAVTPSFYFVHPPKAAA